MGVRSEPSAIGKAAEVRRRFKAVLRAVEREADRKGTVTVERVLAEADALIGAIRGKGP